MQTTHEGTSEAAIFGRILEPSQRSLSVAAAKSILALEFSQPDRDRMRSLLAKAKEGALTPTEQHEIDNYERVGHMVSLMKSNARVALKGCSEAHRKAEAY